MNTTVPKLFFFFFLLSHSARMSRLRKIKCEKFKYVYFSWKKKTALGI